MFKSTAPPNYILLKLSGNIAVTLAVLAATLSATRSFAESATWRLSPISSDWNTAANWMPRTVPNGPADIATFGFSNTTDVSLSANTTVSGIVFNSGAAGFTLTTAPGKTLSLSGSGIINNSGIVQNLVAATTPEGISGVISLVNSAIAGSQTVFTAEGSTADQAFAGRVQFFGTSSAGDGAFIVEGSQPNSSFASGLAEFHDQSTADNGVFSNLSGGFGGGVTTFLDSSTAGNADFTCEGGVASGAQGGFVIFAGTSSAANGTFLAYGPTAGGGYPGTIEFMASSTADQGTFKLSGGTVSGEGGGEVIFVDSSTAADGTFIVEGTSVSGAEGAKLSFLGDSTAGNATIIVNSGNGGGGNCVFGDDSDGGTARIEVFGNGTLTIDFNATAPVTLGSIEGDGIVVLGKAVNVGSNNLSTVFSGVMNSLGPLTKIGTGTLTLTGASTYRRRTTINEGGLVVNNASGSATGTGSVAVDAGTLGGRGTIAGVTTIGTGSGTGAFLEPSTSASRPATLTIQSLLTFKADATYTYKLNTKTARADQVVANGVTIDSAAQFSFNAVANKRLTLGTVFTAISNTSANPITGPFANLPGGSSFTVGRNTFQVSYSGGDGNDLTLTVVP